MLSLEQSQLIKENMCNTEENSRRSKIATYPGFTYDIFNYIFKYITPNLSSNKNYRLDTISKDHEKLRFCCEYFQKWIIEQAITV